MRKRLLRSTLAVVTIALLLFAVPLGLVLARQLEDQALDEVSSAVRQVATFVDQRARTCAELQLILTLGVAQAETQLALYDSRGQLALDLTPGGSAPPVASDIDDAIATSALARTREAGTLHASVPLTTNVCRTGLVLRGSTPATELAGSIRRAWLAIGVGAAVVLGIAALVADALGRRLASPFEQLSAAARRLGDGDFTGHAPRSGLAEADAIADALDATAERLGRALERGNTFTTDAAHQLRTPLTALQLELDVLAGNGGVGGAAASVAAARAAADRLAATVEELVTLTRPDHGATAVDVFEVIAPRLGAWQAVAASTDREVVLHAQSVPTVLARPAALLQAVEVIVDNALEHGTGTVSIRAEELTTREGIVGVRLCVEDEGTASASAERPDAAEDGAPQAGRGRGLPLARSLVEAEGGRLVFTPGETRTTTCLLLRGAVPDLTPDASSP